MDHPHQPPHPHQPAILDSTDATDFQCRHFHNQLQGTTYTCFLHMLCDTCGGPEMICPVPGCNGMLQFFQAATIMFASSILDCTHQPRGCQHRAVVGDMHLHLADCPFRQYACIADDCNVTSYASEWGNHMLTDHPQLVQAFQFGNEVNIQIKQLTNFVVLFSLGFEGALFFNFARGLQLFSIQPPDAHDMRYPFSIRFELTNDGHLTINGRTRPLLQEDIGAERELELGLGGQIHSYVRKSDVDFIVDPHNNPNPLVATVVITQENM